MTCRHGYTYKPGQLTALVHGLGPTVFVQSFVFMQPGKKAIGPSCFHLKQVGEEKLTDPVNILHLSYTRCGHFFLCCPDLFLSSLGKGVQSCQRQGNDM